MKRINKDEKISEEQLKQIDEILKKRGIMIDGYIYSYVNKDNENFYHIGFDGSIILRKEEKPIMTVSCCFVCDGIFDGTFQYCPRCGEKIGKVQE